MRALDAVAIFLLHVMPRVRAFHVPLIDAGAVVRGRVSVVDADGARVAVAVDREGRPSAFMDGCPHRGASFAGASHSGGDVRCPYHNFGYSLEDGALIAGDGVAAGCARLTPVPCAKVGNLIWGCVDGDPSVPPCPPIAEEDDDAYRTVHGSVRVRCPKASFVENVLDSIHVAFVHRFGNPDAPQPSDYKTRIVDPLTGLCTFRYAAGKKSLFDGDLMVRNWYRLPCTAGTSVRDGDRVKIVLIHAVQRADGVTEVYWKLIRNFLTHAVFDPFFRAAMAVTLDEDKAILESCDPALGDRFHGRFDKLQLMYRRALRAFEKREAAEGDP